MKTPEEAAEEFIEAKIPSNNSKYDGDHWLPSLHSGHERNKCYASFLAGVKWRDENPIFIDCPQCGAQWKNTMLSFPKIDPNAA